MGTTSGGTDAVDWTSTGTAAWDTITGLNLTDGQMYFLSVRVTDVAGNVSDIVSGDGILIDLTPPYTGVVYDGLELQQLYDEPFTGSDTTLFGTWESFGDDASGISGYEVSVNNGDVYPWTAVSNVETKKIDGLMLTHGLVYSFDVRAIDLAGNTSEMVSSNGIKVDTQAPTSDVVIANEYYNRL